MKHIVFDFDGVLVDSMPVLGKTVIALFEHYNIPCPDDIVEIAMPLGYNGTAEYVLSHFDFPAGKEELIRLMGEYAIGAYKNTIPAKAFVKETLELLRKNGYSLNILTASPHLTVDPCLQRLGMLDLFDNIWSCDDFGTTKADPQIYRAVAQKLGTTVEECTFLDDNIHSLSTGHKAGMQVIGVYDESSANAEPQMRRVSGRYIHTFRELPALIL